MTLLEAVQNLKRAVVGAHELWEVAEELYQLWEAMREEEARQKVKQ